MPAALVSSVLLLIVLFRQRRGAAFNLALASVGLMVGALVVTLAVNVPIDYQISQWSASTLPPHWTTTRDRWELYHTIRTFASVGALSFAVASAFALDTPVGWASRLTRGHEDKVP